MTECKIQLENYDDHYGPGETIKGRVECVFEKPTTNPGVEVSLSCEEHNKWKEVQFFSNISKGKMPSCSSYCGINVIHQSIQNLYATTDDSCSHYVFPFSFTLPLDIPSSFRGPFGSINFMLKTTMSRPEGSDYIDIYIFKVFSPIDIITFPIDYLKKRHQYQVAKSNCCCTGSMVEMEVNLREIVFVPGRTVKARVKVTNSSNYLIDQLKIRVIKVLKFIVDSPVKSTKTRKEKIFKMVDTRTGARGEHVFKLEMKLPGDMEIPNFKNCKYFESSYILQVKLGMDGCTSGLVIDIHPEFGHVGTVHRVSQNEPSMGCPPPGGSSLNPMIGGEEDDEEYEDDDESDDESDDKSNDSDHDGKGDDKSDNDDNKDNKDDSSGDNKTDDEDDEDDEM